MKNIKRHLVQKNTRGINRDIRLAKLIIKFIEIVSPIGNPIDKFYLARDLKLDGPIEEIEGTINKLKSDKKEEIKDAVLVHLISSKVVDKQSDSTRVMREFKKNILKDNDRLQFFLASADDKVDTVIDTFQVNPIQSANELKTVIEQNNEARESVVKLIRSTDRLINKGKIENERTKALIELENIRDSLSEIDSEDFSELTQDENIEVREIISEITDILYKLKKEM
ncbi:MAG: hypothetical protein ACLU05_06495 [Anaerococcus obesiensis]